MYVSLSANEGRHSTFQWNGTMGRPTRKPATREALKVQRDSFPGPCLSDKSLRNLLWGIYCKLLFFPVNTRYLNADSYVYAKWGGTEKELESS